MLCFCMQEACDLLSAAHASEAELLAAQQPPAASLNASHPYARLLQPKVLCRTPNSITLTHFPLTVKGYRQPISFAVYCKPTGAGVALSINRTAMEYPGGLCALLAVAHVFRCAANYLGLSQSVHMQFSVQPIVPSVTPYDTALFDSSAHTNFSAAHVACFSCSAILAYPHPCMQALASRCHWAAGSQLRACKPMKHTYLHLLVRPVRPVHGRLIPVT